MYTNYMQFSAKKVLTFLAGLFLAAAPYVLIWQRQNIFDWYRLRSFVPSERIEQLATNTTMNKLGQKLFYVHYPQLDDKVAFNDHCRGLEQSIVLGCYITRNGIYIYDVQDARLKGIHEVTAAHEMLHAAYDRLSSSEKIKVDSMTEDAFLRLGDQRIKDTVENYRKNDPSVVPNELHSILGTEVQDLPTELETYYKRYFDDRIKIVGFSQQYEQAFTDLKAKVAQYDDRLEDLKQRINANEAELELQGQALRQERSRLDAMLASNQTSAYNAAVPSYNNHVRQYNNLLNATKNLINEYNHLVEERNKVALEEQELIDAIDSRINTLTEE